MRNLKEWHNLSTFFVQSIDIDPYRGQGIGTNMMKEMLSLLKTHGYKRVSLSVQKANYAAEMYRKIGFEIIKENGDEWIMLWREARH